MDQFSGRQKLTTCQPEAMVSHSPDRPATWPATIGTVGGHWQSSDNWQTLSRARGPIRSEAEDRRVRFTICWSPSRSWRGPIGNMNLSPITLRRRWRWCIDYEAFALFAVRSLLPMFALVNLRWLDAAPPQQPREIEKIPAGIIGNYIASLISRT